MASPLIDPAFIAEIRAVEQSSGQSNVVSGLVSKLEAQLAGSRAGSTRTSRAAMPPPRCARRTR
jgi:hypothetical protein